MPMIMCQRRTIENVITTLQTEPDGHTGAKKPQPLDTEMERRRHPLQPHTQHIRFRFFGSHAFTAQEIELCVRDPHKQQRRPPQGRRKPTPTPKKGWTRGHVDVS